MTIEVFPAASMAVYRRVTEGFAALRPSATGVPVYRVAVAAAASGASSGLEPSSVKKTSAPAT